MIWVTWRQHRTENYLTAAVLAAFGAIMLTTGLHIASAYRNLGVGACFGSQHSTQHCRDALAGFNNAAGSLPNLIGWANFLPLIFGVLLAAPFVLDLEGGTYRLAWTQSVTRLRWTVTKLALIALAAAVIGAVLILIFSWWRAPFDHLYGSIQPNDAFDFEGVAPIGYTLFAIALVVTVGTVLRRVIPAVGISLIVFLGTRLGIQNVVRPHLVAPVRKVLPATADPSGPSSLQPLAWNLSSGFSDRLGHAIPDTRVFSLLDRCMSAAHWTPKGSPAMLHVMSGCLRSHHIYTLLIYQPANRFWTIQAKEFAIYAALSAMLLALTVWWVKERIG